MKITKNEKVMVATLVILVIKQVIFFVYSGSIVRAWKRKNNKLSRSEHMEYCPFSKQF